MSQLGPHQTMNKLYSKYSQQFRTQDMTENENTRLRFNLTEYQTMIKVLVW